MNSGVKHEWDLNKLNVQPGFVPGHCFIFVTLYILLVSCTLFLFSRCSKLKSEIELLSSEMYSLSKVTYKVIGLNETFREVLRTISISTHVIIQNHAL